MIVTEVMDDGEIRVNDYDPNTVISGRFYQWTAEGGWKKWVNAENVEGGGYYRAFSDDDVIKLLEIEKQKAIDAQARRKDGAE